MLVLVSATRTSASSRKQWILQQDAFGRLSFRLQIYCCTTIILDECTTLWGKPDRVHKQNMEQLNAYDSHQNLRPQNITKRIHTHLHTNCVSAHTQNKSWK